MPISEQALYAIRDRQSLFAFLRDQLAWPVDPEDTFTYQGPVLHSDVAAYAEVSQIVPFTVGDPFTIMLAEFETPFRRGDLRAILQKMLEAIRKRSMYGGRKLEEIVFVCATENYGGIRFARFEARPGRQPRLSTFGWDCRHPEGTRTLRDVNLPALAMPPHNILGEPDWKQAHWAEAWNVEKVTGEFYRQYRTVFHDLMGEIAGVTGDARLFTQRLCNRLLFVQFLAKKEWLNRDRNYLRNLWELAGEHAASVRASKRTNFYSDFLHPLFFKALNTAADARPDDAQWSALSEMLGDVPFLNGGLFARQDSDDDAGAVTIRNDAFAPMLDLFDRFNFTLTESTPDDVEVAVDAEMLGKVFEELVNEDERHSTGSYYTPRGIVSFMCREAIKGYLGGGDSIAKFVDEGDPSDLRDPEAVLDALKRVTVCDPACGSGAYLLGMMQELLRLREGLFTRKANDYRRIYDRKLEIIQRNLYGVDKETFAVNIAMLRLWLSLVVDNDAPVADVVTGVVDVSLPNLKFKIQCGDALTAPMTDFNLFGDAYARDAARLRALEDEYFAPPHHDRPGRPKAEIEENIRVQQAEIADLIGSHADARAVDWCVRFAEVFAPERTELPGAGGFCIVLANPPFVRHELIHNLKPALKVAFPEVYNSTADLYTYFYARAVQLLRPDGMLVFISSNKWFLAQYGVNLRRHIAKTCRIDTITDFGDLPVFQSATVYATIFVARKGTQNNAGPLLTKVQSLEAPYPDVLAIIQEHAQPLSHEAVDGASWTLTGSAATDQLRKMEKIGVPLGEYVGQCFFRGIMTGFNPAFFIDGTTRRELLLADPASIDIIKPLAIGEDISRWFINRSDRWLLFVPWDFPMERYPAIMNHLLQWKDRMSARPEVREGKYKWYCMGRYGAAYHHMFQQPKIVYQEIATFQRFAYDTSGTYLNNKVFFIPTSDLYLLGILNSTLAWDYLNTICSKLQGGALAMQTPYLTRMPVPDAGSSDREAISVLVQKCLDAKGVGCEVWEQEINERVAALYGL